MWWQQALVGGRNGNVTLLTEESQSRAKWLHPPKDARVEPRCRRPHPPRPRHRPTGPLLAEIRRPTAAKKQTQHAHAIPATTKQE